MTKQSEIQPRDIKLEMIQATLDCLDLYGYHGTSLAKILEKAGASKGAWSYHFKDKRHLVAEAAKWMYEMLVRKGRETVRQMIHSESLGDVFEYIWKTFYQGKYKNIWLEITIASRTDEALRELLIPVIQQFNRDMDGLYAELFHPDYATNTKISELFNMTFYFLRGQSVQMILADEPDYFHRLRENWVKIVSPILDFVIPEE